MVAGLGEAPHLPQAAPIDAYGQNGFRFGGMSHRGSILCLPSGIWAWSVATAQAIDADALQGVFEQTEAIDTLVIGSGMQVWQPPALLRDKLRAAGIVLDAMQTGPATRVYNIMVGERRRVAAALIAVP